MLVCVSGRGDKDVAQVSEMGLLERDRADDGHRLELDRAADSERRS